jgi:hypothetical protein
MGKLGVLAGPTRSVSGASGEERFTLDLLDLDESDAEPARIPLAFFGHGFAIRPKRPTEAVVFEKRGFGGCVLDLAVRRAVRPIAPMKGHAFYGHSAYSSDGDVLFVVETSLENNEGVVSLRDSNTFLVLGMLPTYGIAPHDCHLVEGGRTLVITNGGGPVDSPFLPSVTFVDVASRALVERHEVLDRHLNAGHIAMADHREFAVVSAPREGLPVRTSFGGVTLRRRGQPWVHMVPPDAVAPRLVGESLSVAIHTPSRTVIATHPDGNLITFWSLDRGGLIAQLDLPGPRGVTLTLDQQLYAVSCGDEARLLLIEAASLRVLSDRRFETGIFGGAHLYTWKR